MAGHGYSHFALVGSAFCIFSFVIVRPLAAQLERADDGVSTSARIQRLIDEGKLNLSDGVVIERIPTDARDLGVVYNDAHRWSGSIAAVPGVEAIVHKNDYDSGFAFFMNYQPTTGAAFPGAFLSDNLRLGGGFKPGDSISSYEVKIFRSSRDPITNLLADVRLELWDGDPLALQDTASGGFSNAPIPGSAVTFSGIGIDVLATLRAVLDPPVVAPNSVVWLTMTGNSCRLGWILSSITPTIGSTVPDVFERQLDSDGGFNGNGICCDTGEACDVALGITCADDTDGTAQMCSDGDAEDAALLSFGGPCTGDVVTDSCSTFVNYVRAPAKVTISLVPVSNGPTGGIDPGVVINGSEITLPSGGGTVYLEARISDWDLVDNQCVGGVDDGAACNIDSDCRGTCRDNGAPCRSSADCPGFCDKASCGTNLQGYVWQLESAGLTSGVQGTLAPKEFPCTTDADCLITLGGACEFSGTQCTSNSDCTLFPGELCLGMDGRCLSFPSPMCSAGFILSSRSDFVFSGRDILFGLDNVFAGPNPRLSAIVIGGGPITDTPDPFPAGGLYAGTLVLDVPADAAGTFTIDLLEAGSSSLFSANQVLHPLLGFIPAKISITDRLGRCCVDDGVAASCIDGLTMELCDSTPFSHKFVLGGACSDPGVDCALPATLGRCCTDDGNVATCIDDLTREMCDSTPFSHEFVARGSCSAPGVTCKLPPLFGRCCIDDRTSSICVDGVTRAECESTPFSRGYVPGETCAANNVQCVRPPRNRYLSVSVGDPGVDQAVRVTFTNLPAPFDVRNGMSMWVRAPFALSENGHNTGPTLGFDNFMAATLQCDPVFLDWASVGTVEVFHENIVPGGTYTIEVFNNTVPPSPAATWQPFELVTGSWGDLVGAFDPVTGVWPPPDGSVDVPIDVIAAIGTFGSARNFARKVRIDLDPSTPDGSVNITDVVAVIDAFSGKPYQFAPTTAPCP